jgi:hypothetical protein
MGICEGRVKSLKIFPPPAERGDRKRERSTVKKKNALTTHREHEKKAHPKRVGF